MSSASRDFAVVIHGATGFTGSLVAEYFARHVSRESVPWALSGRNTDKLAAVRDRLAQIDAGCADVPLLNAANDDPTALASVAARTRVLISTVGPYAQHGIPVVAACVQEGTDYLDITGEPLFVRQVQADFHARAVERDVALVSCCGFDSIPTDLGVLYTVRQLPGDQPMHIDGFIEVKMQISGGTWNSALGAMGDARKAMKAPPRPVIEGRSVRGVAGKPHRTKEYGWVVPMPTVDPEIALRSAAELPEYGPDFSYAHYACMGGIGRLAGMAAGATTTAVLAQSSTARNLLGRLRKSGDGPSREALESGWFKAHFHGRAGDASVRTEMSGGDPGYLETSKMVSEAALALATQRDQLPRTGGALTTALCMGDVLIERLSRAGIRFRVVDQ